MTTRADHNDLRPFIDGLPRAGLHMHIEGSLEPEMMFALAERNAVKHCMARNSFTGAFLDGKAKARHLDALDACVAAHR